MRFNLKELLTLQKLIVKDSPDTLLFSEKELIKMAYFDAEEYLRILYESIQIANNTANPNVFFSRYDLIEENLHTLSLLEPYIKFKTENPSDRLHIIHSIKQDEIHRFLSRYFYDAKKQADKLKTDKGKFNKYEKFYQNLQSYYELMNSENIDYAETCYNSMIETLKNFKDDSKCVDSSDQENEQEPFVVKPPSISPDWNISVSFGYSSSQNFDRALYLAKQAPKYDEQEYNSKKIYQATYGKDEEQYLAFIQLYEMIKGWKSTAVFINGKLIDRKIVGGLNYCYGDKCRNGNPVFCYGASFMTKNPFGCHRLQVSACNHPWWSFSEKSGDYYRINKDEIKQRIDSNSKSYKMCPCFDEAKVYKALEDLPTLITTSEYNELRGSSNLTYSVNVNITPNFPSPQSSLTEDTPPKNNKESDNITQQAKATASAGGCILPIISIIVVIVFCLCLFL